MARSSSGQAKPDGMRRRAKGAKPDYLSPRRKGNRQKEELQKFEGKKSTQSHKKRT